MKTGVDKILQQMGGSPEKNKTGVDKILEILENGGGGGGGGLPEYTSADKGKVLTIGDDAEHPVTDVVVPEQTVTENYESLTTTLSYTDVVTMCNNSTPCVLTLDGNTYNKTFGWYYFGGDDDTPCVKMDTGPGSYVAVTFINDNRGSLRYTGGGSHTVSVSLSSPAVAPVWDNVSGLPEYTSADKGKLLVLGEGSTPDSVEPKWESVGYVSPASSATVTNTIQSLVSDVMTSILTGSKTNIVMKSAVLTHSDLASDYAILRETAEKYCSGVHTLFPVATDAYSTVVNGYAESGGTGADLQIIVPNYGVTIPGVGTKVVTLAIALSSSGQAYKVSVSAQIKEDIT